MPSRVFCLTRSNSFHFVCFCFYMNILLVVLPVHIYCTFQHLRLFSCTHVIWAKLYIYTDKCRFLAMHHEAACVINVVHANKTYFPLCTWGLYKISWYCKENMMFELSQKSYDISCNIMIKNMGTTRICYWGFPKMNTTWHYQKRISNKNPKAHALA